MTATKTKTIDIANVSWVYLGKMSPSLAQVLVKAEETMSRADLAVAMDCSISTVQRRLTEAKKIVGKSSPTPKAGRKSNKRLVASEIAKKFYEDVKATGGKISQKDLGAIWGKSQSWAGKAINS